MTNSKPFSPLAGIESAWRAIYFIATLSLPLLLGSLLSTFSLLPTSASAQPIPNPHSITRVSSFQYNAQGLLIQEVIEPDSPQSCLITSHAYDGYGNKSSVSTSACAGASGATLASASTPRVASSTYSADGRFPALTTNALGHSESKQYDSRFGLPTSLVGPNGLTTTWAYDGFGRKVQENRADGSYSTWSYLYCTDAGAACPSSLTAQGIGASNGASPILAQTPVWHVTERSYSAANLEISAYKRQYHDALNRVIRVETLGFDGAGSAGSPSTPIAPIVQVQDTAYNALGQIARKSNTYDAANPSTAVWVAYTYDVIGRLIKEEAPDPVAAGGIASTFISYNGLSSTITNSKGQGKTTTKDALGRTSSVTDTQGNQVSYQYDALGQLIQTDAAGNITRIQYNLRGQKIRMDDPAMGVWEYQYNAFGELVSQTDSLGQSSSIAYDRLGRMIQRNESDLISHWVYDNCAKGIGKLCQASSDNGYHRVHSYDSLGRASSTSTKLDATVTTSISYEAGTGRVASQTYPTGYQVSYQYTQLGYLKTVTGQGATGTQAGFTQQAKYEILNINAQGQITRYKYGNQIVTNKTYDAQTGRLHAITATQDGLATGGIQQTTYQYDSLANLTARADVNTGVQETFLYDQLNRLTNYQALGGSVTSSDASANVEVRYDARGNILYKSDVGRYWYDPQRPNRLTNITLEAPAGAAALTGTRALAYAFDDYQAGARTLGTGMGAASGVVMGNGNLMYTVSQDNQTGRHSVRWESYTSFNMPKELASMNLGQAQTSTAAIQTGSICPAGATSNPAGQAGSECIIPANTAIPATPTYAACPAGYSLTGSNCTKTTTVGSLYNASNTCLAGDTSYSTRCEKPNVAGNTACKAYAVANGLVGIYYWGSSTNGTCEYRRRERCPAGSTSWASSNWTGNACYTVTNQAAVQLGYQCPAGTTAAGSTCIQNQTQTVAITPVYSCPSGSTLSGNRCFADNITSSQVANRTLTFTYGPEHQRISQRTQLDASAPASMSQAAGIVYYLNAENNNLSYEKEVKDNGLIEHKHYLSAGGMVFAMQISRTGNLATGGAGGTAKPQHTLQYLHHDHLGSVAVVTDDTGSVAERLAYDPWGKRRFPNGMADTTDSIVGLTLDRGFTMHEHLDEMGVIHMNGRIYDPLIGRFMSADPFIQAPDNLQSHNRFAYVMNNPLSYTDPSGYFSLKKLFRAVLAIAVGYFTGQWIGNAIQAGAGAGSSLVSWSTNIATGGSYASGLSGLGGALAGAGGGFAAGLVGSGSLKGALQGAFSGGVFGAIGGIGGANDWSTGQYVAAHAAGGCITSVAGGGQCGSGALSAAFGKFTTLKTQDWGPGVAQFTASVVAGGVGSVIGGGKFENGAITAAFAYAFNNCFSQQDCWQKAAKGFTEAWKSFGEKYISASTTALGLVTMVPSGGGSAAVVTTIHGAERIAGAAATRGGVLSVDQALVVQATGRSLTQADGAAVRILENSAGRFDIVVSGERGIITTFNNIRQKSMDKLAERYGWK